MKSLIDQFDRAGNWSWTSAQASQVIQQAVAIQQIPAPTFDEQMRANYVADQFRAKGVLQVETDSLSNVYGLLPGTQSQRKAVMISAHTDTVFARETDLHTHAENGRLYGPGLGDNSLGVAALIALPEMLRLAGLQTDADIWLVANSREEGLGDLGGMKAAFAHLKDRVGCVINLEGMALGFVYHAGIAVRRFHITAQAEGGHSWLNFGRPSAIHAICELGVRIAELRVSESPRTTYNIGLIEGGQSINSIASRASLWLDLRSEDSASLEELERQVHELVRTRTRPEVQLTVELVGNRPQGMIARDHPLVVGALTALTRADVPASLERGSTDANVPLSEGCPAVTIGITRGGNAHRLDEYIETGPVKDGLKQLVLLALAASASGAQWA